MNINCNDMNNKRLIINGLLALLLVITASCESWISVEPSDRLTEDEVFSSQKGFLQSLNGIYAEMNNTNVYGGNLSVGVVDVLAQYYDGGTDNSYAYYYYSRYDYTATSAKATFASVWSKMYSCLPPRTCPTYCPCSCTWVPWP